jgi:serine/threonine protein kinase/tetratricopeptide (TPR) repeat protein
MTFGTGVDGPGDAAPVSLAFLSPAFEPDELGRLAHYRVLKVLGQGGMGVVLLAEDTHLRRRVALKVIRPEVGQTPANRERFLREARAMAQVRSDHVVTVYQVGQADDVCFLAMELLEGEPLDRWLERVAHPPFDEVLRIGREIAIALAAAHDRGLIHRDVKPANVWLEAPTRRVKLLDFGLARTQFNDARITSPGIVVGTPMYMAPEQAQGEPLDDRSDLFSLGCVLYEMLTGRPPFDGANTLAVLAAVITNTPPPADHFNPAIPAGVTDLLTRLLAKDPASRPAPAETVAEALQGLRQVGARAAGRPRDTRITPPGPAAAPDELLWSGAQPQSTSASAETQAPSTAWPESSGTARRRARAAERRQVTVLVGGWDFFESDAYLGLETEDQAHVLRTFQQACERVVRSFDGAVVQCNEQGLIACFGYPMAYEDAAARAARAGLRLLEEVTTPRGLPREAAGTRAKSWIGLHTGSAIVEVKEDAVSLVGDVRNVAVRLKDVADPGAVVCTDATRRLFRGQFQCTALGDRTLKGVNRPVPLFRVERGAAAGSLLDLAPTELSPLTGRDQEISLLRDRWERAREEMGQVVLLIGEPGLGKSRLVHALKDHVLGQTAEGEADAPVIEWRCSQHFQNTGLHPAIGYHERALGFRPEEPPADRFDRLLSRVAKYGLDRPEMVPLWAALLSLPMPDRYPPLGLPPARLREETFRLMQEWLHVLATRGPVLFVVEDLHWCDASTLEFLGQFLAEFQHDPVLAVFTFRPEFRPPWAAVDHQTSLALTRLTRRQVGDLVRKRAGEEVSDAIVEQVYDRAGGIPLFVEEFTKMVQDGDREGSGGGHGPAGLGHEIPSTLQDLVMARLDRTEGGRELAQLGAVLGREFSHEVLAAVAGLDESTLKEELARLAKADILYAKGRPPRCTYTFKHALLEDALYNALVKAKRQEYHRRVGEVLESQFPQTAATQPELLGRHFTEAGLAEKAVGYWLKAGQRSRDRSAFTEAIGHLTRGLSLVSALPESGIRDDLELQFLTVLGPAYISARGYAAPEAGPVLVRARDLCRRIGDTRQQLGIMLGLWEWHIVRGDLRTCAEQAADGIALAESQSDAGMMMEALFMPGVTIFYRGQFASAREYFERALAGDDDRARTKSWSVYTGHDAGVTHRCYLALTLWHLGCPERALVLAREACDLARAIGHAFSIEHAVDFAAFLFHYCRLGAELRARGEEEIGIATEQGFPFWHALGTLHKGAGLLHQGPGQESLDLFLKGFNAFRATGAELRVPAYLGMLGDAFTRLGRFGDARRALDEALAVAEKNDDRCHEAELHRLAGELLLAEFPDRISQADDSFRRAIDTARAQQSKGWELRARMSAVRLWERQGRKDEARAGLADVFGTYTEGFNTPDLQDAKRLLESFS